MKPDEFQMSERSELLHNEIDDWTTTKRENEPERQDGKRLGKMKGRNREPQWV